MSDSAPGADAPEFRANHVLEYAYRRSLGPTLSRFFTGLRDHRVEGVKTAGGRVLVPPSEYDPETGEATSDEWVEVGPGGTIESYCWVAEPLDRHPLDRPFAFALVKLDGADTALLHAVDAVDPAKLAQGTRVKIRWADETVGRIQDIACFEPEDAQ